MRACRPAIRRPALWSPSVPTSRGLRSVIASPAPGAGVANHAELIDVPVNLSVPIPAALSFDAAATVTLGVDRDAGRAARAADAGRNRRRGRARNSRPDHRATAQRQWLPGDRHRRRSGPHRDRARERSRYRHQSRGRRSGRAGHQVDRRHRRRCRGDHGGVRVERYSRRGVSGLPQEGAGRHRRRCRAQHVARRYLHQGTRCPDLLLVRPGTLRSRSTRKRARTIRCPTCAGPKTATWANICGCWPPAACVSTT